MSDTSTGIEEEAGGPQLQIRTQYIKDLSFENPNAPQSLLDIAEGPDIGVTVNVSAEALSPEDFEVVLHLNIEAKKGEDVLFLIELEYAGVFTITDADEDILEPLCMIECPRFLFPFAREIVAAITKDSGLPPLLLEPMDFTQIYLQAQQSAGAA